MPPKTDYISRPLSDEALAWIVRQNSGNADPDAERAFLTWLARSPEHKAAWEEAKALWQDMGALQLADAPPLPAAYPAIAAYRRREVALAAGGLIAAFGGGAVWYASRDQGWTAYRTGTAEVRHMALEDGSELSLNARSAVSVQYTTHLRRLRLEKGEIDLTVAPEAMRTCLITAGALHITTASAHCSLSYDASGSGSASFALISGSAIVNQGDGPGGITLGKGEVIELDTDGHLTRRPINPATVGAWQHGLLVAENERLDRVLSHLNAYYHGWIFLRDSRLADSRVNTVLELHDIDQSLHLLAAALPLRVRRPFPMVVVIDGAA